MSDEETWRYEAEPAVGGEEWVCGYRTVDGEEELALCFNSRSFGGIMFEDEDNACLFLSHAPSYLPKEELPKLAAFMMGGRRRLEEQNKREYRFERAVAALAGSLLERRVKDKDSLSSKEEAFLDAALETRRV
jgi:thioredoxin-related protein